MKECQSLTECLGFVVPLHAEALSGMHPPEALAQDAVDLVGGEEVRQAAPMSRR
jgi:hypothetical protein